jgi:hypothetical protein
MDYLQLIFAEVGTSLIVLHDPITIRCPFGTNNFWRPVQAGIGVIKIDGRLRRVGGGMRRDAVDSVGVQFLEATDGWRWGPVTGITLP